MSPTLLCPQCNASFIPPPTFPSVEQALHSNVLPSNEERSLAHGILEQERYQLKLYDEELDRLDGITKKLREERDGLARRIKLREGWSRSSASGIQRLPAEALAEIFSHLCSASDYTLPIVGKHIDNKEHVDYQELSAPPLTLSQVSHYWRKVAFSCPALWSSIEVDLTGPSTSNHEIVLSTYFKNAASHSLDITIRGSNSDLEYDFGANGPTILEPYSHSHLVLPSSKPYSHSHFDLRVSKSSVIASFVSFLLARNAPFHFCAGSRPMWR
ncbi:hypothetical protein L218DRAFT_488187 [Marasmius fiardii PR-910]|nr:hypothetical protein L218DRAFT_488187 [Marasmius fiardii PR-910]